VARFSQRIGARPPLTSGVAEASQNLRVATWNLLHERLLPVEYDRRKTYHRNGKALWSHLHWTTDTLPHRPFEAVNKLKNEWMASTWEILFDTFEFSVELLASDSTDRPKWFSAMNTLLEKEGCAYRFVAEELVPITNPTEVAAVTSAADCAISAVGEHIRGALTLLPPNPDSSPRNSVKESLSAVESALKHLTGKPAATLGEGLREFESKYGHIHESIRRGLDKLYAYTNQPDGIRHALVDDAAEVTVDDARFMVVTCSAFANYLVALSEKRS
jgi:hypothetical protein